MKTRCARPPRSRVATNAMRAAMIPNESANAVLASVRQEPSRRKPSEKRKGANVIAGNANMEAMACRRPAEVWDSGVPSIGKKPATSTPATAIIMTTEATLERRVEESELWRPSPTLNSPAASAKNVVFINRGACAGCSSLIYLPEDHGFRPVPKRRALDVPE